MSTMRQQFALTLALAALVVGQGSGQTPTPASSPVAAPYSWPSSTVSNSHPTVSLPGCAAPPACAAHEDDNGRLLVGDPLLDGNQSLGWFGVAEVSAMGSSVATRLRAPVALGGVTTLLELPSADLQWTAMPRVELGYRWGQASGALIFSYRGLNTQGTSNLAGFDAAGNTAPLSSHLTMTVFDMDYASDETALAPLWDMKWRTGGRVTTIFFDSSAATPLLLQHESNNFVGGGIHFGLDLRRRLADTGFSIVGQVDGGMVLGRVNQLYAEAVPGLGTTAITASAIEPAPTLDVRLGLDWSPLELPNLHFSAGYAFERWWTVGETTGRQGEVTVQGVFVRGEWRY